MTARMPDHGAAQIAIRAGGPRRSLARAQSCTRRALCSPESAPLTLQTAIYFPDRDETGSGAFEILRPVPLRSRMPQCGPAGKLRGAAGESDGPETYVKSL